MSAVNFRGDVYSFGGRIDDVYAYRCCATNMVFRFNGTWTRIQNLVKPKLGQFL